MPPEERFVPRFFAEPPQEALPYGRWAERIGQALTDALRELHDAPADLGQPGEIVWYPDRGWHGRTYVPFTAPSTGGYELFGHVRFICAGEDGGEPSDFSAHVDFTDQTVADNPHWRIDLCDEVIGRWRGHAGALAAITLVWGRPLLPGGAIVTAELAELAVDQCELVEDRFTLIAPDDYRRDLLEIRLWDRAGRQLASESLYEDDDEEEEGEGEGRENPPSTAD